MDNKFYNFMLAGYKDRLSNNTLEVVELEALLALEREKSELLEKERNNFNAVLASDTALKELFDEAKDKFKKETLEEA